MKDLGIVKPGSTIYIPFATYDSNDPTGSVTLTGLALADIKVYKNGGTTERASTSGYTLLDTDGVDFDAVTGIHGFSIDLSNNTTAGFWEAGAKYFIVLGDVTVDAGTIRGVMATFEVGYPDAIINTSIATLATQTGFTLTAGPAENDALNGCVVCIHDVASAVQLGFAEISDYTGSSKTVALKAATTFTVAAGDNISIFRPSPESILAASQPNKITFANGIRINKTTANEPALELYGNGTGAGLHATGGALGPGIEATGGASGGHGIEANGSGSTGDGIRGTGQGVGEGIGAYGGAAGHGMVVQAGGGNASGIVALAQGTSAGIVGMSAGSGAGMRLIGATNGNALDLIPAGSGNPIDYNGTDMIVKTVDDTWDENITAGNHNVAGSAARFVREGSEAAAGITDDAQAGAAGTITLAAGASATDNIYNGERISILEGTGAGQSRIITAYNGTTKVATVNRNWTTNPDSTSKYSILGAEADVAMIEGSAPAADNFADDYDGTGYDKANSTIGTCTTNTDMRGTDNAATASALATVDANVDAIKAKTDLMVYTKANELDVNVKSINGATVIGDGNATPWDGI